MDTNVRPILKKLIIAAVVFFVIGITVMLCDIYYKIGNIEHFLTHHR